MNEASLLGWIAGDGGTSPKKVRKHSYPDWVVYQSKVENFAKIEAALADGTYSTHTRSADRPGYYGHSETTVYRLRSEYVSDLSTRLDGLDPKTGADKIVLRMSADQRDAWLDAMWMADGNQQTVNDGLVQYYQNPDVNPAIANAIELAIYLTGKRPSLYQRVRPNGSTERCITETSPYLGGQGNGAKIEDMGRADVWCVTTDLHSWTAKGGDFNNETSATADPASSGAFLTGNTGGRGLIGLMVGLRLARSLTPRSQAASRRSSRLSSSSFALTATWALSLR
jgi:hypothetical protein